MSVSIRKRILKSGKTRVYFDIYGYDDIPGHKKRETKKYEFLPGDRENNKRMLMQAELIKAKIIEDLNNERWGLRSSDKRERGFVKFAQDFIETRTAPNTKISYKRALQHLINFGGAGLTFASLTTGKLEQFRAYLLEKVSANSAQMYFVRIKTVLRKAVNEGNLAFNPAAGIIIKKQEKLPSYLTIKEIRALAKTPCQNAQVKAAFLFSCFSGLRYGDVDSLTWDRVKEGYLVFTQRKTGIPERLPLSQQALKILRAQKRVKPNPRLRRSRPANCVFLLPSQQQVDRQLKGWAADAGIGKSISFHKARHTFATLALSSGVSLYVVSKLLGHKNVQTTEIYTQVIDSRKRRAIGKLPRL